MAVPKKHERLQTVLNLEKSIDIRKAFESLNGYRFIALADDTGYEIWFEDKCVAHCCHSEEFYRFLARHHRTWTGYVSQPPILADGWMVIAADTLFIIENQSKLLQKQQMPRCNAVTSNKSNMPNYVMACIGRLNMLIY